MKANKGIRFLNLMAMVCLFFFAFIAASLRPSAANTATVALTVSGTCDYNQANAVVTQTNALRAEKNLAPLVIDQRLTTAAMQRAAECAFVFSHDHIRPDGSDWNTINPDLLNGENIAAGNYLNNAIQVIDAWRNSDGHYRNIIDADFQSIGVGCFRKGNCTYWVQSFSCTPVSPTPLSGVKTERFSVNIPLSTVQSSLMLTSPEKTLKKGASNTVKAYYSSNQTYTPVELDCDQFVFSSLSPEVASVNAAGKVTGLSAGSATICATLKAAPSVTCSVDYSVTDANGRTVILYGKGGKFTYGKSSRTFSVSNGSKYGNLPQPTRKGYAFAGWFDKNGKRIRPSMKVSITKSTTKKLYAKWTKIKVGKASLSKAAAQKGRTVKATVRKVSGAKGYEIYLSSNKKFNKKSSVVIQTSAKKRSVSVAYTQPGKYVYVKARAYKIDSAGKAVYGKFSAVKKVKLC